jgi:hypothetical protein
MIADRWKLIGQGLLIDSTGDRWIRGLTGFWWGPKRCLQIDMLFLERGARRHVYGSQKRMIVACEKVPGEQKALPKPPVQLKNIPSTSSVRKALASQE